LVEPVALVGVLVGYGWIELVEGPTLGLGLSALIGFRGLLAAFLAELVVVGAFWNLLV
jgi:hypothetical protein